MSKLTAKEDLFAHKVVELDNQSEALRVAYPYTRKWKDEAVWARASELASKDKVKLRIEQIKNRLSDKQIIRKEELLEQYAEMFNCNPLDFLEVVSSDDIELDEDGNVLNHNKSQSVVIKDLKELSVAQQKCIKSIKPTRNGIEIELYPKTDVGDRIAKMLGFNEAEKVDVNNTGSVDIKQLLKLSRND